MTRVFGELGFGEMGHNRHIDMLVGLTTAVECTALQAHSDSIEFICAIQKNSCVCMYVRVHYTEWNKSNIAQAAVIFTTHFSGDPGAEFGRLCVCLYVQEKNF